MPVKPLSVVPLPEKAFSMKQGNISGWLVIPLTLLTFVAALCKKESAPLPEVVSTSGTFSIYEDDLGGVVYIPVEIATPADKPVKIYYSASDITALAGIDYVAVDSFVTIPKGKVRANLPVTIIPNSSRTEDAAFSVHVARADGAILQPFSVPVTIVNTDYARLAWSDEFDASELNTANWNFELGNNNGWGNNELEIYTNSAANVFIENGNLVIRAIKDGNTYTSGRITTQNKRTFTFGKTEIRAILPEGKGIWPALWMLGNNISTVGWPKCGEIDIMELLGQQPEKVYGTVHYDKNGHQYTGSSYMLSSGTFSSGYHVFSLVWQPNHLKWYVDGQKFFEVTSRDVSAFPWNLPQFYIFNVAVGGNWPGNPDATTSFPQQMVIDYIRVYQ